MDGRAAWMPAAEADRGWRSRGQVELVRLLSTFDPYLQARDRDSSCLIARSRRMWPVWAGPESCSSAPRSPASGARVRPGSSDLAVDPFAPVPSRPGADRGRSGPGRGGAGRGRHRGQARLIDRATVALVDHPGVERPGLDQVERDVGGDRGQVPRPTPDHDRVAEDAQLVDQAEFDRGRGPGWRRRSRRLVRTCAPGLFPRRPTIARAGCCPRPRSRVRLKTTLGRAVHASPNCGRARCRAARARSPTPASSRRAGGRAGRPRARVPVRGAPRRVRRSACPTRSCHRGRRCSRRSTRPSSRSAPPDRSSGASTGRWRRPSTRPSACPGPSRPLVDHVCPRE